MRLGILVLSVPLLMASSSYGALSPKVLAGLKGRSLKTDRFAKIQEWVKELKSYSLQEYDLAFKEFKRFDRFDQILARGLIQAIGPFGYNIIAQEAKSVSEIQGYLHGLRLLGDQSSLELHDKMIRELVENADRPGSKAWEEEMEKFKHYPLLKGRQLQDVGGKIDFCAEVEYKPGEEKERSKKFFNYLKRLLAQIEVSKQEFSNTQGSFLRWEGSAFRELSVIRTALRNQLNDLNRLACLYGSSLSKFPQIDLPHPFKDCFQEDPFKAPEHSSPFIRFIKEKISEKGKAYLYYSKLYLLYKMYEPQQYIQESKERQLENIKFFRNYFRLVEEGLTIGGICVKKGNPAKAERLKHLIEKRYEEVEEKAVRPFEEPEMEDLSS